MIAENTDSGSINYMPNRAVNSQTGLIAFGEHAWRTDISQVSSKWEREYNFGSLAIREIRAFWTAFRNVVAE